MADLLSAPKVRQVLSSETVSEEQAHEMLTKFLASPQHSAADEVWTRLEGVCHSLGGDDSPQSLHHKIEPPRTPTEEADQAGGHESARSKKLAKKEAKEAKKAAKREAKKAKKEAKKEAKKSAKKEKKEKRRRSEADDQANKKMKF